MGDIGPLEYGAVVVETAGPDRSILVRTDAGASVFDADEFEVAVVADSLPAAGG